MKLPRYSLKFALIAVAVVAAVLACDRNVESRLDQLQEKIESEHQDVGMWFIQEDVDKSGMAIANTTTTLDRVLFRRRMQGKFISITQNTGGGLHGNKREVSYLITPFDIQETETITKW